MSGSCQTLPTWNEEDRIKAIDSYEVMDTPREEEFDDIVKIAAQICNVPISLISFVATGRQWFKAGIGTDLTETPLNVSICSHAILQDELFVISDTSKDPRTAENPLVKGDPHLRFYAGAVLESPEGLPLGTLCILDYQPRTLTDREADTLKALAKQVMTQLELRRTLSELRRALRAKSKSEERLSFLGQLTLKLSMLSGPEELNRVATREVGQFLGCHRCYFVEALNPECNLVRVLPDWCAGNEKSLQGEYDLSVFGEPEMWETLKSSSASLDDVGTHPWTRNFLANYEAMNLGAVMIAPFSREGKWVTCLGVSSQAPRQWTPEERDLLEDVMARVWPLIERARIELELRLSEQRFRAMSDNIAPLAWMAKGDGYIFWYNKRWYDYTGENLETMQGDGWAKVHDPEHLLHVGRTWKKAITQGLPWEDTFPLRGADGKFRWFLSRAYPIHDADGTITLWFGVNTDITELRHFQNALLEANTLLGDKAAHLEAIVQQRTAKLQETIAELEAFSFSISHDMRSPLRAMQGYSDALLCDHAEGLDPEAKHYLNRIHRGATRLDLLIRDVLAYSKVAKGEVEMSAVEMEPLVADIIENYPDLHPGKIKVTVGPIPKLWAHEGLLTQIISNLLGNAVKFTAEGTFPTVSVTAETVGDEVKIYFTDNGIGIDPRHHRQIFQIFGRVYPDNLYEGTGIGLAVVRKAAERMDGTCGVEAAAGGGSRFWITLKRFL